jgi:hypothetical protein
MTANIVVDTDSLDAAAKALREVAEDMRVCRFDAFLLDHAGIARCPREMAKAMRAFADFAHERYRDTVALAAQLSVHLALAAANYRLRDIAAAEQVMRALTGFVPRPAGQ